MSRSDTSYGIRNYTQVVSGTSETPLLAPSASGVYSRFPSPLFPLSTTTYPVGLFISVPPDVSPDVFDGHPFEVQMAGTISGATTTNCLVNLYNAKKSTWSEGPYSKNYTIGTLGTGCTNIVTGTATSGITSSASINFWLKAQFLWDSTTKILSFGAAAQYMNGSVVAVSNTASVSGLSISDLNFIPSFTFSGGGSNTVTVTEFAITRL